MSDVKIPSLIVYRPYINLMPEVAHQEICWTMDDVEKVLQEIADEHHEGLYNLHQRQIGVMEPPLTQEEEELVDSLELQSSDYGYVDIVIEGDNLFAFLDNAGFAVVRK